MSKHERQTQLINFLRSTDSSVRPLPTSQLAAALGASMRTIERDIIELKSKGAPIKLTRGRLGGIEYAEDPALALIVFTRDEACALRGITRVALIHQDDWINLRTALSKLNAALER